MQITDLRTLTAARFFAALWVVLFHLRGRVDHGDGYLWQVIDNGARGVDFFFILSGYVIYHAYQGRVDPGRFIWRRVARLYPLHIVMLAVFLALSFAKGDTPSPTDVAASALLLHSWGVTDGLVLNGPSWTISAEMFAYLAFAVIAVRSTGALIVAAIATAVAAHIYAAPVGGFMNLTYNHGTYRIVPLFILGMLLRKVTVSERVGAALFASGVCLLAALAWVDGVTYPLIAPFCLIILGGAAISGAGWNPLNSRAATYLGEISYSTYMVHVLVIIAYFDVLKIDLGSMDVAAVVAITVLASAASYRWIENPARRAVNARLRLPSAPVGTGRANIP